MKVHNISEGPRGLNTLDGQIMLAPDEERDHVRISEAEAKIAQSTGWFELTGRAEANPAPVSDAGAGDSDAEDQIAKARQEERDNAKRNAQAQTDAHERQLQEIGRRAAAAEEALDAANKAREAAEAEVKRLTEAAGSATEKPAEPLAAVHKGGGSYAITRGDAVLKAGLTRDEAEAFNKLSEEARITEVAKFAQDGQ